MPSIFCLTFATGTNKVENPRSEIDIYNGYDASPREGDGFMNPQERLKALCEAPPDGWVAFSEDESRVVAYGATYEEAVFNAEKEGENDPLLVKIPNDWTELVLHS